MNKGFSLFPNSKISTAYVIKNPQIQILLILFYFLYKGLHNKFKKVVRGFQAGEVELY
ncbi:hypothetical protein [uncultured Gammaproteobacteria bacterium]|jgi:hypothetical protein|nr:hypothetical protein BROOK1789B_817 [Bathymodiolus brooksi thiotrophic gill symbiont]CAC9594121.1 hypothetical protein [uncultured Gammaproteobacteria bacterium]CAC9599010.1 hypothetical protein [uncultured Gammaproteobacteria bacterium]CAC9611453.1 hypothetical protein [uncultured Gammaproteobacteria bacterium]CAC9613708.1 hypothetical protein [uncultured Gammaproteobacteria bacterium]